MISLDDQFKSTFPEMTIIVVLAWVACVGLYMLIRHLTNRENEGNNE